jgi:hypothetical protein
MCEELALMEPEEVPCFICRDGFGPTCEGGECLRRSRACIEYVDRQKSTLHTKDVKTSKDHTDMMKIVAEAEGTSHGVTVSASAKYHENNEHSSNSINFVLGETTEHGRYQYKNYEELTLVDAKDFRDLLINDPEKFQSLYGEFWVGQVTTGASFSSAITVKDTSSASSSELSVFLKVTAPIGEVSGGFDQAMADSSENLEIRADRFVSGGPIGLGEDYTIYDPSDPDNSLPNQIKDEWTTWRNGVVRENVLEQQVVIYPWNALLQVTDFVYNPPTNSPTPSPTGSPVPPTPPTYTDDELSDLARQLLYPLPISPVTFETYTEARTMFKRALSSTRAALEWNCMKERTDDPQTERETEIFKAYTDLDYIQFGVCVDAEGAALDTCPDVQEIRRKGDGVTEELVDLDTLTWSNLQELQLGQYVLLTEKDPLNNNEP